MREGVINGRLGRLLGRVLVALLVAAMGVALAERQRRSRLPIVSALVPAYFYPLKEGRAGWDQLAKAAESIPTRVILNPSSGPGRQVDLNYVAVVQKVRDAGCQVFGYVHTSYGARDLALVKSDVEAYLALYRVDGFFVDEMSTHPLRVPYYAELYDFIKARDQGFAVVGNPGTGTDESYLQRGTADTFVLFEGPVDRFVNGQLPSWVASYPASRFAAIVYGTSTTKEMKQVLEKCVRDQIGLVYISDRQGANPYDRLPEYWTQETTAMETDRESRGSGARWSR